MNLHTTLRTRFSYAVYTDGSHCQFMFSDQKNNHITAELSRAYNFPLILKMLYRDNNGHVLVWSRFDPLPPTYMI